MRFFFNRYACFYCTFLIEIKHIEENILESYNLDLITFVQKISLLKNKVSLGDILILSMKRFKNSVFLYEILNKSLYQFQSNTGLLCGVK